MIRYMIDLEDLGFDTSWLLIQQVLGMPDPKMQSDYLTGKVALMLFFRPSLPERLCITAAVRQMSGSTVYQGNPDEGWGNEIQDFQEHLMPIFGYYLDLIYCYGVPMEKLRQGIASLEVPLVNAGSPNGHPAHALADVACMLKVAKSLQGQKTAWVGCANGTLYSLMKTAEWFKFSLKIAIPENIDLSELKARAIKVKGDISFVSTPEEAARGADFIYAGFRGSLSEKQLENWQISPDLMSLTNKARLLLCASPMRAISISPEVLESKASMLTRQAEYRLRLHKRLIHWIFEK